MNFIILFVWALAAGADIKMTSGSHDLILKADQEMSLKEYKLNTDEVYVSNYLKIEPGDQARFKQRKIEQFKKLFGDELDPYTKVDYRRSRCLGKSQVDRVDFKSGPGRHFTDCKAAHKDFKESILSSRRWISCGTTVWEVTLKNPSISISCL